MRMSSVIRLLPLLALCTPSEAIGQADTTRLETPCSIGAFQTIHTDSLKTAEVTGTANTKLHFLHDDAFDDYECPRADDARCMEKSYVVAGNRVLVSQPNRFRQWICAWYQAPGPAQGESVGWLPLVRLRISETAARPRPEQWVGTWWYYDSSLEIRRDPDGGSPRVVGRAGWRDRRDHLRTTTVDARATLAGNALVVRKGRCWLSLALIEPFVVANDVDCGPANAPYWVFRGFYQRDRSAGDRPPGAP